MKREKAIKSVDNRRIESPETCCPLDFREGDIVQIKAAGERNSGRVGMIIGIQLFESKSGNNSISYCVKFSDNEASCFTADKMRFVKANNNE